MTVAYNSTNTDPAYVFDYDNGGLVQLAFPFVNTGGNALCILASCYGDSAPPTFSSVTCNGTPVTVDWNVPYTSSSGDPFCFFGGHLLNVPTGTLSFVLDIVPGLSCYDIKARVVSVSGAKANGTVNFNKTINQFNPCATSVISKAGDLVIGIASDEGYASCPPSSLNGTIISSSGEVWASYQNGAASVSVSQTASAGFAALCSGAWSFPAQTASSPSGVTVVSGISDPGDVTNFSGVSVKHTGVTLTDLN